MGLSGRPAHVPAHARHRFLHIAARSRQLAYAWVLPVVFATLHFSYGVGALLGVAEMLASAVLPLPSGRNRELGNSGLGG